MEKLKKPPKSVTALGLSFRHQRLSAFRNIRRCLQKCPTYKRKKRRATPLAPKREKSRKPPFEGDFRLYSVELVGFEPTSKQGNHMLSTRLFRPSVFVLQQDPDHQLQPYPLNFTCTARHIQAIPDFTAPLCPQIRNNILGAMSRSATLWPNKANLLCFD